MSTIGTVLTVVLIILTAILAAISLMQSKRSAGLGAVSGGSGADTFWSKNKGNSVEGKLEKYTKILGAAFMISAFIVNLVG